MDEKEWKINLNGIRWSYLFLIMSLFIWGIYNFIHLKEISLPIILILLQFIVYFFVTTISKYNIDNHSVKKQLIIYILIVFFVFLFGLALYLANGQ